MTAVSVVALIVLQDFRNCEQKPLDASISSSIFDHPVYGLMIVRLQTWLPFSIQVAPNGQEWLARPLIDDYAQAQHHVDAQLDTRWEELLSSFLPDVFPPTEPVLGDSMEYYWTV